MYRYKETRIIKSLEKNYKYVKLNIKIRLTLNG